jgi:hypothetical protein
MCSANLSGVCTKNYRVHVNMCTVCYELSVHRGYRTQSVYKRECVREVETHSLLDYLFIRLSIGGFIIVIVTE